MSQNRSPAGTIELAHTIYGEGFPLLLVHGFTGSSLDWIDVVEPLTRGRSVITLDHRGHGESLNTGDAATYSFDQLVADMSGLVDRLELDQFDLLGHSMGGIVAMRYTLLHPERVRSLVLMDTAAGAMAGAADFMRAGIELVRTQGTGALFEVIQGFLGTGERADVMRDASGRSSSRWIRSRSPSWAKSSSRIPRCSIGSRPSTFLRRSW